jgi:uncharacterized repeat protein (TIGR03803 family)
MVGISPLLTAALALALGALPPLAGARAAATETVLYGFQDGSGGAMPLAGLIADKSGALYGTTYQGGSANAGTVFKATPPAVAGDAWSATVLYSFQGGSDGKGPKGGVIADAAGALYGTTYYGGGSLSSCPDGCGTAFKLTPPAVPGAAWTETVLHRFQGGSDGKNPPAGLVADAEGALYGTTMGGGGSNCSVGYGCNNGTVFKLIPPAVSGGAWTETVLYSFLGVGDGALPMSGLIVDKSGTLYGTTLKDGAQVGVVFTLTPPTTAGGRWTETVLYTFEAGGDNGRYPIAGLIADRSGALYGTTSEGGSADAGTVFKLTPPAVAGGAWTATVLYSFQGGNDGKGPEGSLIADAAGALHGVTGAGGGSLGCNNGLGCGTVFRLTPPPVAGGTWTETVLYRFQGGGDGDDPRAGLIADAQGTLYGTSASGGGSQCPGPLPDQISGCGTVFRLIPPPVAGEAWTKTVIHRFQGVVDGKCPMAALFRDKSGALYGTTPEGGSYNAGAVFKLSPPAATGDAWIQTLLYSFPGSAAGAGPTASLVADAQSALYGTTSAGGGGSGCPDGCGTVFKLTPPDLTPPDGVSQWSQTVLYRFQGGSGGSDPETGLIIDTADALYGTTLAGGGTVFKLTPPTVPGGVWTETVLHSFQGDNDGALPSALIADNSGALYGTTFVGGSGHAGTVFKLTPPAVPGGTWNETVLHNFQRESRGCLPDQSDHRQVWCALRHDLLWGHRQCRNGVRANSTAPACEEPRRPGDGCPLQLPGRQ